MRFLAMFLFCGGAFAQDLPDGAMLMIQAQAALRKYHSIQFVLDRTLEVSYPGKRQKFTDRVSIAFVNPGKMRMESRGQIYGDVLLISDSHGASTYDFSAKLYWSRPAVMDLSASVSSLGLPNQPGAAVISMSAQTLRQEVITIDGQKHDCWVVQNAGDEEFSHGLTTGILLHQSLREPVWTLWLDKKLGIDLQSIFSAQYELSGLRGQIEIKTVKKSLKLNAAVPDSRFTLPQSYRAEPGNAASLGTDDFFIDQTVVGKLNKSSLTDERWNGLLEVAGHPVLIVYAPTWCQPCRQSMPVLAKLYQEFKDQGLIVIQAPVGEDRATLERFLATAPVPYPVASGDNIVGDLKLSGYPTFVMFDRSGDVVANQTGFVDQPGYDEAAVRRMLALADLGVLRPDTNLRNSKRTAKKKKADQPPTAPK